MARRVREDTYLTRDESQNVQDAADRLDVSKSEFIRDAINEKLQQLNQEASVDD